MYGRGMLRLAACILDKRMREVELKHIHLLNRKGKSVMFLVLRGRVDPPSDVQSRYPALGLFTMALTWHNIKAFESLSAVHLLPQDAELSLPPYP